MKNRFLTGRDHEKLFARSKRLLDRELSKPSAEWDESLIEELEKTMLYCAERKRALAETRSKGLRLPLALRKALVAAAVVIAVLAISASVAQAAGFRVWSALVHWDAGMLRITNTQQSEGDPPTTSASQNAQEPIEGPESVVRTFENYDELLAYLDGRVPLPAETAELRFASAIVTSNEDAAIIRATYQLDGEKAHVGAQYFEVWDDEHSNYNMATGVDPGNVTVKTLKGYECTFAASKGRLMCFFGRDGLFYNLDLPEGTDKAETIVNEILDQLADRS